MQLRTAIHLSIRVNCRKVRAQTPEKGTLIKEMIGDVFMLNLKRLKLLTSKATLRAGLAFVLAVCMLVLMLPADFGALLVGASSAANEWNGEQLEQFQNYTEVYQQFANGTVAYQIANAKQLAFLAAVVNATPTDDSSGCQVHLDMDGDGTADSYYYVPVNSNVKFELTADIDLNDRQWTPIGIGNGQKFFGTFDGKGHIVSGLSYVDEVTPNKVSSGIGLFGQTGNTALIQNLHVKGTLRTKQTNMGGIVGYSTGALQMENCSFSGTVQGSGFGYTANVGGLLGNASTNQAVAITDCFVYGEGTAITGVPADAGSVTGDYRAYNPENIGGLVGYVGAGCDMTITGSYAECTVTGWDGSGGLVGTIGADSNITTVQIMRCYTAGSMVTAARDRVGNAITGGATTGCTGGLVGWVRNDANTANARQLELTIEDCYSVMDLTKAPADSASGLVSYTRHNTNATTIAAEDVQISLQRCHFAGLDAKQPFMYYESKYCTVEANNLYYRAGSTTAKTHTLQGYETVEEKNRKEFLDGRVVALLGEDTWMISNSNEQEYPVLGPQEKPTLESLSVNNEPITLVNGVFEYTAQDVDDTAESVLISATPSDGATVTVNGTDIDANTTVSLGIPGTTTAIKITVTSHNVFSTTYTVNVYRKPVKWDGKQDATFFAGGDGSETKPYQITTGAELALLAQKVNEGVTDNGGQPFAGKHYKLMNDIDLGNNKWDPIGDIEEHVFRGTFNGGGHTIFNLYINSTQSSVGLFGFAAATIENLSLMGADIKTENVNVAGFVGYALKHDSLTIRNCNFSGKVEGVRKTENVNVAAFVGGNWNSEITIDNCDATGTITSKSSSRYSRQEATGGLVAIAIGGTDVIINNSSFDGTIDAANYGDGVGGLVGAIMYGTSNNSSTVTITNSYSKGTIKALRIAGGLVGYLRPRVDQPYEVKLTIKDCYSTATIEADTVSSGLLGRNYGSNDLPNLCTVTIENSFFAGKAMYPIMMELDTDTNDDDTGAIKETLTNVYYRTGSATIDSGVTSATTYEMTAAEFADGTVANALNNGRKTAVWATSTTGYPVLSDLAATLEGAFDIVGTSIRTEGVQALRFKFSVTHAAIDLKELKKVGILVAKEDSDKIAGEHLYAYRSTSNNNDNDYNYASADVYTKGGSQLTLINDGYRFLFTAALYNIQEEQYGTGYIARPYAKYVDAKGQELIAYGETIGEKYFNSVHDIVDAFFLYSSPGGITMKDLQFLREIYEERYEEQLVEVLPDADELATLAGGDNPQVGGADTAAADLRDTILGNTVDVDPDLITQNDGTVYYISPSGNDANDGKTTETAWKSVDAINLHSDQIDAGDAVLFERGGVYRSVTSLLADPIPEGVQRTDPQQVIYAKSGVTYGAYGEGAKPAIYSCHRNYAKFVEETWSKIDGTNIWKVYTPRSDAGSVVFNHGEAVGIKRFGVWDGTYTNGKKNYSGFITPENVGENLTENFEYYHDHRNGVLYLYYDNEGKAPYEVYSDIEICPRDGVIRVPTGTEDILINNLSIKYTGFYGVSVREYTKNVRVTYCEFGWIGGCQWYFDTYEEGSRIGNAIEFWETTTNATTDHNWIYQVFDAGLSPQGIGGDDESVYKNLRMTNNLVEYCSYGIEWFDRNGYGETERYYSTWDGYYIENNILRFAGYGFGRHRKDGSQTVANINGWNWTYPDPDPDTYYSDLNPNKKFSLIIRNNIFDCSAQHSIYWCWSNDSFQPVAYTDETEFNSSTALKKTLISGNSFYERDSQGIYYGYYEPDETTGARPTPAPIGSDDDLKAAIERFDSEPGTVDFLEPATSE